MLTESKKIGLDFKLVLPLLAVLASAMPACGANCLEYGKAGVSISGRLVRIPNDSPGDWLRTNYGRWRLDLDQPICIAGREDEGEESVPIVRSIELVTGGDGAIFNGFAGKLVTVTGEVVPTSIPHEHSLWFEAKSISSRQ